MNFGSLASTAQGSEMVAALTKATEKEFGDNGATSFLIALFLAASFGVYWSRTVIRERPVPPLVEQVIYLPSVDKVRLVTLGFDNLVADILWFDTLNYFGKHLGSDRNFEWMGHRCELVTDLDPKSQHAYEFCSNMLSWITKEPKKSEALLTKAIAAQPSYWRNHYLRGFTYWYFLEEREKAQADLTHAARLPDAPAFIASLASRMLATDRSPHVAMDFLRELIAQTKDENAKKALQEKYQLAHLSAQIEQLDKLLVNYQQEHNRPATSFTDLVRAGMLPGIPRDPFGEAYVIDQATGKVLSSSGKRGLQFHGKTAATGLASRE